MIITKQHIKDLLHLMTFGLIHGAGNEYTADKSFCVQQAVHKVIRGDLKRYANDSPTTCIDSELTSFGVRLNDATGWNDNRARAEGLKRFAIAEMGTADMEEFEFEAFCIKLSEKLQIETEEHSEYIVDNYLRSMAGNGENLNNKLTRIANTAADVLQEMKTPGSEFLYLVDEPDKKKQTQEAHKLGHKMFAAQMADFSFKGCEVKPKQKQ